MKDIEKIKENLIEIAQHLLHVEMMGMECEDGRTHLFSAQSILQETREILGKLGSRF